MASVTVEHKMDLLAQSMLPEHEWDELSDDSDFDVLEISEQEDAESELESSQSDEENDEEHDAPEQKADRKHPVHDAPEQEAQRDVAIPLAPAPVAIPLPPTPPVYLVDQKVVWRTRSGRWSKITKTISSVQQSPVPAFGWTYTIRHARGINKSEIDIAPPPKFKHNQLVVWRTQRDNNWSKVARRVRSMDYDPRSDTWTYVIGHNVAGITCSEQDVAPKPKFKEADRVQWRTNDGNRLSRITAEIEEIRFEVNDANVGVWQYWIVHGRGFWKSEEQILG